MNAALNRPALNMTILVSVIFHLAVLYYLATTWQILPTVVPTTPDPGIRVERYEPPPPIIKPDEPPPKKHPIFQPRNVETQVPTTVEHTPLPPQTATEGPAGPLTLDRTIPEEPTSQATPLYPRIALEAEKEGHVRLSITILPDGSVTDVEIVSANPPGYFEQSAIDAVKRWHYKPSATTRRHVYVDIDYELRG
jgi:protein TonB